MRAMTAILSIGFAAGCSAHFVEKRPRRPGPVPEVVLDPGGGHLRYSLKGPAWVVKSRREDAVAKMGAFCGGESKVKILDEVSRDETAASYGGSEDLDDGLNKSGRHYQFQKAHHLYFECAK